MKIFLDNNATTKLDPAVLQAMLLDLQGPPANPSSIHAYGQRAYRLLQEARNCVANFFEAPSSGIIFTSGGTESINLFLRGLKEKGHIITSNIEHSATYLTCKDLEKKGFTITFLPVGPLGAPTPEQVLSAIRPDTKVIALSAANNETGVKIDLKKIAQIALEHQIAFLVDAVCFIGKEPWVSYPGISAIAISAHKFHGPKGIGALILRSSQAIESLITGGFQESNRRAGTENLAGILGLAKSLSILQEKQKLITQHLKALQQHLESTLQTIMPDILINGEGPRISNTSNLFFPNIDAETLLIQLDRFHIAASHGSACSSGAIEPSRVLMNMGFSKKRVLSSIRISTSKFTTLDEIDELIEKVSLILEHINQPSKKVINP